MDPTRASARRAHSLGRRGEDLAAVLLEARGFALLARNARLPTAEFDLVGEDADGVAFVEVKSRTGTRFGEPWQAVDARKRERLVAGALAWLEKAGRGDADFRFGVVSIVFDRDGRASTIEWIDETSP